MLSKRIAILTSLMVLFSACSERDLQQANITSEPAQQTSGVVSEMPVTEASEAIFDEVAEASIAGQKVPEAAEQLPEKTEIELLGNNQSVISRYEELKTDAQAFLTSVNSVMKNNKALLKQYQDGSDNAAVNDQTQQLKVLRDQAEKQFGVGVMAAPFGQCGSLGSSAQLYWQEQLQARVDKRKVDIEAKGMYEEDVQDCKKEIDKPPIATVTIAVPLRAAAPAESCRRVPQVSKTALQQNKAWYVCLADDIEKLNS